MASNKSTHQSIYRIPKNVAKSSILQAVVRRVWFWMVFQFNWIQLFFVRQLIIYFSFLNFPTEHGEVFVWGFGLIGLGPKADQVGEPTQIPSILLGRNDFSPDSRVRAIYAGFSHFGAVTSTQDLYMWGKNRSACLGLSNEKDQYFPLKVAISAKVEKIDCGVDHTVAYCRPFM